ncbi:DUF4172 domain-containing protein [Vreelandella titanicae]|uniref:DUF4172 domain-containing protein n=1 Tax=Vreelandella titanicae TaxID=664683 RepID=UPI0023E89AAD|nr:DUF4172 domain-containing protein [Halomonas titanicae]
MYIWEQRNWPDFERDEPLLRPTLNIVRLLQGRAFGKTEAASTWLLALDGDQPRIGEP